MDDLEKPIGTGLYILTLDIKTEHFCKILVSFLQCAGLLSEIEELQQRHQISQEEQEKLQEELRLCREEIHRLKESGLQVATLLLFTNRLSFHYPVVCDIIIIIPLCFLVTQAIKFYH